MMTYHERLSAGMSTSVDKAKILPNINADFEGKAPDAGAIEYGKPTPHYGPRSTKTKGRTTDE